MKITERHARITEDDLSSPC